MTTKNRGWQHERYRHGLSSKGVKSAINSWNDRKIASKPDRPSRMKLTKEEIKLKNKYALLRWQNLKPGDVIIEKFHNIWTQHGIRDIEAVTVFLGVVGRHVYCYSYKTIGKGVPRPYSTFVSYTKQRWNDYQYGRDYPRWYQTEYDTKYQQQFTIKTINDVSGLRREFKEALKQKTSYDDSTHIKLLNKILAGDK